MHDDKKSSTPPLRRLADARDPAGRHSAALLSFSLLEIQPTSQPAQPPDNLLCWRHCATNTPQQAKRAIRQVRKADKPCYSTPALLVDNTQTTLTLDKSGLQQKTMPNTGKSHGVHAYPSSTLRDKSQRPLVVSATQNSVATSAYMAMVPPFASLSSHTRANHRQHYGGTADAHDERAFLRSAQQMHEKPPSAAWRDEIEQRLPLGRGVKRPAPTSSSPSPSPSCGVSARHCNSYSSGRAPPAFQIESSSVFSSHSQQHQPLRVPVSLPTLSYLLQRTSAVPAALESSPTIAAAPLYKHQRMFAAPPPRATNDDLIGADTERLRRILDEEVAFYNQRSARAQQHGHEQLQLDAAPRAQERVHAPDTLRRSNDDHEARRRSDYAFLSPRPFLRVSEPFDHKELSESSLTSSCSPGSSDAASPPMYPMKQPLPPRSPKYSTAQQQRESHHHRESHALSTRCEEEQGRRVLSHISTSRYTLEHLDRGEEAIQNDEDNAEDRRETRGDSSRSRMPNTSPPSSSRYPMERHHDAAIEAASGFVEERSPSKRESITKLLLKSKEFLQAKSLVRNRNNEIDWVATFLNVGFESSSIYSLMCPLRKGRWKVEEEKYTMELLRLIESGTIRLRHGQSIRGFVAKKLHSDDMRVLKKLSNCKMFHFARLMTPQMTDEDEIDESVADAAQGLERLRKLRSEFLRSVQLEALVAVRKYLSDSSIRELLNGHSA